MEETAHLLSEPDEYELSPLNESHPIDIPITKEAEPIHQDKISIRDRLHDISTNLTETISIQGLVSLLLQLVPSFLQSSTKKSTLHSTSWLDGLRGVAAFIVYIGHFILFWFPGLREGFGSTPTAYHIAQLPILRIIYCGGPMVTIFFIVSGYALSYSALKKLHSKQYTALLDTLASAVFRRSMRLNLPIMVSTFIAMIIGRFGGWTSPFGIAPQYPTFWGQLRNWWLQFILISNPVMSIEGNSVYNNPYGFQLWTIPREFRGSLLVYLTLLCVSKAKQAVRTTLIIGLASFFLWIASWDLTLFLIGIFFAEIDVIRQRDDELDCSTVTWLRKHIPKIPNPWKTILHYTWTIVFATGGLFVMSFPERNLSSWGYAWMIKMTPRQYQGENLTHRFWVILGTIVFFIALCYSPKVGKSSTPFLQIPFNTPVAQYLGRISYAIYIIHGQILFTLGYRILRSTVGSSPAQYILWFLLAVVVNTTLCVWAADVFWRFVDAKAVSLAKSLATKCFLARD